MEHSQHTHMLYATNVLPQDSTAELRAQAGAAHVRMLSAQCLLPGSQVSLVVLQILLRNSLLPHCTHPHPSAHALHTVLPWRMHDTAVAGC